MYFGCLNLYFGGRRGAGAGGGGGGAGAGGGSLSRARGGSGASACGALLGLLAQMRVLYLLARVYLDLYLDGLDLDLDLSLYLYLYLGAVFAGARVP